MFVKENSSRFLNARVLSNFLVLIFMMTSCRVGQSPFDPTATPTLLESRKIVSSNLNLTEIWRFRTGLPAFTVSSVQTPPFLFITKDKVIVATYGDLAKTTDGYLTALSPSSGEIIWQTAYHDPDYGVHLGSAYLNTETKRLFLMYSFRVSGFDIETGKQLWVSEDLGGHTGYTFAYKQENMLVVDSSERERITIDPSTGQVLSRQKTGQPRMIILRDGITLVNNPGFMAIDRSNQTIWTWHQAGLDVEFWPSFVDDDELIAEFGGPVYYLARINYHTGQAVWESVFYIMSNYALLENRVFALIEDGSLVALDLESGQVVGLMQFDKRIRTGDFATAPFLVAASDPYLFTYFGDTQELVAFKLDEK